MQSIIEIGKLFSTALSSWTPTESINYTNELHGFLVFALNTIKMFDHIKNKMHRLVPMRQ